MAKYGRFRRFTGYGKLEYGGSNLLLDLYGGASAAYSVRQLSSTATNSMRVRRSIDNAEQDIGFVGGELDTTSLLSFVGANDGFVVTWYDQSGNANDSTNSTAAEQPQIVSSGSVNLINSKPSLSFGTTSNLSFTSLPISNQAIFATFNNSSDITTATGLKFLLDGTGILTFGSSSGTIANERVYWATSLPTTKSVGENTTNIPSGQHVLSMLYNTSTFDTMFRDGVSYALANGSLGGFDAINFPTNYIRIGRSTSSLNDNLQEMVIYPSNQSSNQSAIESNINSYYSIF